jgi:hypothetical protein
MSFTGSCSLSATLLFGAASAIACEWTERLRLYCFLPPFSMLHLMHLDLSTSLKMCGAESIRMVVPSNRGGSHRDGYEYREEEEKQKQEKVLLQLIRCVYFWHIWFRVTHTLTQTQNQFRVSKFFQVDRCFALVSVMVVSHRFGMLQWNSHVSSFVFHFYFCWYLPWCFSINIMLFDVYFFFAFSFAIIYLFATRIGDAFVFVFRVQALMVASMFGSANCVRLLLGAGADKNAKSSVRTGRCNCHVCVSV